MPPNFQSSSSSHENNDTSLFSNIPELQQLLETVKPPTLHPDANFPTKKPSSLNPTFGISKPLQPIEPGKVPVNQITHYSSLKPTPTSLSIDKYSVRYLCGICQMLCKSASKYRAHFLNSHKTSNDLNDAPTLVFLNDAPIGMEHIEGDENGYHCNLCGIDSPNARGAIIHICSRKHWTNYQKPNEPQVKIHIPPLLYINKGGGYLDAFPFVDSVRKLALSKEPVVVFDEVKLSSADYSVAEVFDLALIAALRSVFEHGNKSIGFEYVKQFIDNRGLRCHYYCEACNCRLQQSTEKTRKEHTVSSASRCMSGWTFQRQRL